MKSEAFLELGDDDDLQIDPKFIHEYNTLSLQLEEVCHSEASSFLFKQMTEISDNYVAHIIKDSFQWTSEVGSDLKLFFSKFLYLRAPMFLEFANTEYLARKLHCSHLRLLCQVKMGRIGGSSIYDIVLRALSNMLKFFVSMHLKKSLIYKPKLDTSSLHLYDPCYREKVREINLRDPDIQSKFFNDDFNIKEFVIFCLSRYFPNVSWRWLGGDQFAHHMTLKIILIMFEYGMWILEDLDMLLEKIYVTTEILFNLENNIEKDCKSGNFGTGTKNNWRKLSTKCRTIIASIYLHIVMMYYDNDVMSTLPRFNLSVGGAFSNEPLYVSRTNGIPDTLFKMKNFKIKRFYTYIGFTLVTYIKRYVKFEGASGPNFSKKLTYISDLLFSFINQTKNSFFYTSLSTLQPQHLNFYLLSHESSVYQLPNKFVQRFKHANYLVQTCATESVSVDAPDFLQELKDLLSDIRSFFGGLSKKPDQYAAYQLSCLLCNIPQYLLSFMHFVLCSEYKSADKQIIMREGLSVLLSLARSNCQVATNIFSGYNFHHIREIMKKDMKSSVLLIAKIFGQSSAFHIMEGNQDILKMLVDTFAPILAKFVADFKGWGKDRSSKFDCDNLACLVILNKLFQSLLKRRAFKNFKFELLISKLLFEECFGILTFYAENRIEGSAGELRRPESFHKLENILRVLRSWEESEPLDQEAVINEAINSTLNIFATSITRIVIPQIFDKFYSGFKDGISIDKFLYLFDSPSGQRIFGTIIRTFSAFMIFCQNNLMNLTDVADAEIKATKGRYLSSNQIEPWIPNQLKKISKSILSKVETEGIDVHLSNFLLKSYIPSVFKYFSGIFAHMSDEEFIDVKTFHRDQLIKNLGRFGRIANLIERYFMTNFGSKDVAACKSDFIRQFIHIQETSNMKYCYPKSYYDVLDDIRNRGTQLLVKICRLYLWDESKVDFISSFIRYSLNPNLNKIQETLDRRLEGHMNYAIKDFKEQNDKKRVVWTKNVVSIQAYDEMQDENNYNAEKTLNVVKYFDFQIYSQNDYKVFSRKMDDEPLEKYQENNGLTHWRDINYDEKQQRHAHRVVTFIKARYLNLKDYFVKRPHMNQIFQIFMLKDAIKNNILYFIDSFIDQIMSMDYNFENIDECYLACDSHLFLIITMDTLIRTSKDYRQAFYDRVTANNDKVILRLWHIHKTLANFLLYKTFLDDTWHEIFVWYYLLSNFIQNLCEDNFSSFKNWFFTEKTVKDGTVSLIEDYFLIIEKAFKFNELPDTVKEYLRVNDRPELTFIYDRLIVGLTEFINGGKTLGQNIIYEKQIDKWVGIVLRVVDDVDSQFYELKHSILIYINALVEGGEEKPVNFIASNFSVSGVFKLMTRLIKKLFIRQFMLKKERKKKFWDKKDIGMINVIRLEDEVNFHQLRFDLLLDYYKKYDATFSDHVIINTVVSLYSFMRAMGKVVLRYGNFLKELNSLRNIVFEQKYKFQNETYDLESITIWHFITTIIIELEIKYLDKFSNDKRPRLILHHFKKLPICFFLTNTVKEDFHAHVNINTLDLKHEAFYDKAKDHIIIMRDLQNIFIKSKVLFYTSTDDAFTLFMQFLYVVGITVNLLFLFFYNKSKKMFLGLDPQLFESSINHLAIADTIASFLLLLYWFLMKYPTVRRIKWEAFYTTRSRKKKPSFFSRLYIDLIKSIVKINVPRSFFLHGLFSLLGRIVNPFFYTLLLLLVVDLSMLAKSVVISFVKNYDKLGYTLLMILVIINFFAYLAADFFEETFIDEAKVQNICSTYFSCLMNSLDIGVRTGGGIADKMILNGSTDSSFFGGRFIFDILFFILINIILLGIFFGIIVDSFQEYRDQIVKRAKDHQFICFTCGLSKAILEKSGIEFDRHLEYHNIWNYFFYTLYLKAKPVNSYNGVDIYIDESLEANNRAAWMPILTTIKYEKRKKEMNLDELAE